MPAEYTATRRLLLPHALALALFFTLLESLKAMRSSQWGGNAPEAWWGLAAGLAGYTVVFLVLVAAATACFRRVRVLRRGPVATATLLAGALAWCAISVYREFTPTLDDALVLGGVSALAVFPPLAARFTPHPAVRAAWLLPLALLAAHGALHYLGHTQLFAPNRSVSFTVAPVLAAAVLLAGLLPCRGVRAMLVWTMACVVAAAVNHAVQSRQGTPPGDGRPNLVLIVSDSLRADYLSAYGGHVATPHLEALAETGLLFEESTSLAPWTLPSMTALFASHYPPGITPGTDAATRQAQLYQYGVAQPGENLAVRLREAGYATGAFTANAFLPSVPGLLDGYETRATSHPILLLRQGPLAMLPFLQDALAGLFPAWDPTAPHDTTQDMTHYAERFIARNADRPFCLYVHYIDPHAPYAPPKRFRDDIEGPWPFFYPYLGGERWGIPVLGEPDWAIRPEDRPYVQSLYEGEVRYIDAAVGRLVRRIEQLGLVRNTVLCFTSDHGEELWDHGRWGHGQTLHGELVGVPLILAGPGVRPGRVTEPVSAIDLMPTLAELLDLAPSPGWRGVSLAPTVRDGAPVPDRPVFAQATSDKAVPDPYQMVRRGRHKLIREAGSGTTQLYDLEADPGETTDLATQAPERARALEALLMEWLDSFDSTFVDRKAPAEHGELFENLRGMGYL